MNATFETKLEMAVLGTHGDWTLVGHFETMEEAKAEAVRVADDYHHDDSGAVVFGLSSDSHSGHYETRLTVIDGEAFITG